MSRGFFDAIWPDLLPNNGGHVPILRLGDILNFGKAYLAGQVGVTQSSGTISSSDSDEDINLWHVFGDPTLEIWTARPNRALRPEFEIVLRETGRIQLSYGAEGAIITILRNGVPLGRARVLNGVADIHLISQLDPAVPTADLQISASVPGEVSQQLSRVPVSFPWISEFDGGDEGWTTVGDARGGAERGEFFRPSGGNPGGYVVATDLAQGETWYWKAPKKILGDRSDAYGRALRFELKQSVTSGQYDDEDVTMVGGGLILDHDTSYNPGTDWTPYSVRLHESAGWVHRATGAFASREDMLTVLSTLTDLLIRGEYAIESDTGGLDNVELGGEPPMADLSLSKADLPDPVRVGESLVYTIIVTNNGPDPATRTVVEDILPRALDLVSFQSSRGSCARQTGGVACLLGHLLPGDSATVEIVATATEVGDVENTADVSAAEADPDRDNDSARETTTTVASAVASRIDLAGNRAQTSSFGVLQSVLPDVHGVKTQGVKAYDRNGPTEPFRSSIAYLRLGSASPGAAPYAMTSTGHAGFSSFSSLGADRMSFDFQGSEMLAENVVHREAQAPVSVDDPLFSTLDNVVYFREEASGRNVEKRTYVGGIWSLIDNRGTLNDSSDDAVIASGTIVYITLFLDYTNFESSGRGQVRVDEGSAFHAELTDKFGTDTLDMEIISFQSPVFQDDPAGTAASEAYAVFGAAVSLTPVGP